jgi:hypothetical protein
LLLLRKQVIKPISVRSHLDAGIQGLTLQLRPEERKKKEEEEEEKEATACSRNLGI